MRPRHAVLLSPLGSAVPIYLPIGTLNAPVTSLESALTSPYQLTENTATLSPTESALTRLSRVTPLDSALTKNMGVGAYTSQLRTGRSLLPTPHATQVLFFTFLRTLLRFSARRQNSTHLFSIASTLFAKNTLGGGGTPLQIPRVTEHGSRFSVAPYLMASSLRYFVTSLHPACHQSQLYPLQG